MKGATGVVVVRSRAGIVSIRAPVKGATSTSSAASRPHHCFDPRSREGIAEREHCGVRKVNRTLSLAFLAPDLVKAAIDGRLPHGMGVTRLADLPAEWSRQRRILGLLSSH